MSQDRSERLTMALVTIEYPPDPVGSGLATYHRALAEGLAARGHRVHVVTRARAGEPTERLIGGVHVHRVGPSRPWIPRHFTPSATVYFAARGLPVEASYRWALARTLHGLVRDQGVQMIESVDMAAEALWYRPSRHPRVPFVVRLHTPTSVGEWFDGNLPEQARRFVREIERRHVLHATHLTGVSQSGSEVILDLLGLAGRPVTVLPNPPSITPIAQGDADDTDPNLVLFVGRINRWKGTHLLMQAVPLVRARRPETRFELVGDAAYTVRGYASMEAYLRSLLPPGHQDAVRFAGLVPHGEVRERMRRAAVCVFPSLFEAFGYTCAEAMACGRPIVAGDHGGMVELLDGGRCGLLFTPPDVEELADCILRPLRDPILARELGARARDRIATTLDLDAVLDRFEAFYRSAIADLTK